jgi:3-isopropylmalate/(R)-2-methylmalate dehydratase large subunit
MGLTLIEKILLQHSSSKKLDDFVYAKVDFCFGNDITAPLAVKEFVKAGFNSIFNNKKIGFVCDHFTPARDAKAANNVKLLKDFSAQYKIKNFFDINHCGVEHAFLIEQGFIIPGNLIIGADSHTCTGGGVGAASFGVGSTDLAAAMYTGKCWFKAPKTIKFIYKGKPGKWVSGKDLILAAIGKIGVDGALYQVMEFCGPVIDQLDMEARLTMTNMAIEAGGKTGMIAPDNTTFTYLRKLIGSSFKVTPQMRKLCSDKNANYSNVIEFDVTKMEPQVACPHLPSNTKPVSALTKIKVNQVVIGSCTNGRINDLRIAAEVLKNKKVHPDTRTLIIPATPAVYLQAEQEGLLKIFLTAGCVLCPPTCGPCLGGHMGILAQGEVGVATTNRNFIGRMGSPQSFVYLASPAVAAATAIKGKISNPEEIRK